MNEKFSEEREMQKNYNALELKKFHAGNTGDETTEDPGIGIEQRGGKAPCNRAIKNFMTR